ncbi:MAG: ERAP1-like C-terminal domain-containing protein, partial [Acidobacteriota bacterium]
KYEVWMRTTFGPGAAALGILPKDSDDLDAETEHEQLLHAAGWLGRDPELVKQSVALAEHWRELSPAVRATILDIAVDASPELGERITREVRTEADRVRRTEMYWALAAVRDAKRYEAALQLVLDPSLDIRETMVMLFGTQSEATRAVAERFFRDHEAELMKRMPQDEVRGGLSGVAHLFAGACDAQRRDELADYITKHFGGLPGGERVAKQAIEGMDQCIASRAALEPEIRAWLGGYRLPRPDTKKPKDKRPKK